MMAFSLKKKSKYPAAFFVSVWFMEYSGKEVE